MSDLYLTPAAIGYLTQIVLALAITGYLLYRLLADRRHGAPAAYAWCLTSIFVTVTVLVLLLFGDAALPPSTRLYAVYLENTVIGLLITLLLQFAYAFPQRYPQRRWEARLALAAGLAYTLWEAGFAVYRGRLLWLSGQVLYRHRVSDIVMAVLFLSVPLAFLRQGSIAAHTAPRGLPATRAARAARAFALIFLIPLGLSLLTLARDFALVHPAVFQSGMSAGILLTQFLFALNYLNALPAMLSFRVRLGGVTLVTVLAVFGAVGWAMTPPHATAYRSALTDHQTLRFTPNRDGGYDVTPVPFLFDVALGEQLSMEVTIPGGSAPDAQAAVAFAFPFYGQTAQTLWVLQSGAVGIGAPLHYPSMEYEYATTPAIFPLSVALNTNVGGVFAKKETAQLTLTWQDVANWHAPQLQYTFQLVLHRDGVFTITTHGLPEIIYQPGASPFNNVWVQGATPGRHSQPPEKVNFADAPLVGRPQGLVQDYYLEFRRDLHRLLAPLAALMVVSSLLTVVGFPAVFYLSLSRPLNALLAGVRRVRAGDMTLVMPVQHYDEIGFLTEAFNAMLAQLRALIAGLEMRVAARTQDLTDANIRLRAEMDERTAAEAKLATFAERERLSRELHDGLGQTLGYINVEAQAAQMLLAQGLTGAAQANLAHLIQAAQEAHADVRANILGLRATAQPERDMATAVRACLTQFSAASGVAATLSWPADAPTPTFAPAVEEQVLRIIQEALTNARKHAHAQQVKVMFSFTAQHVLVMISDDGVGFEANERMANSEWANQRISESASSIQHPVPSFGLTMMHERAAQIGGQLEVRSAPGQGTRVLLTAPRDWPASAPEAGDQAAVKGLRVLLVDDSRLFLSGLRNLLAARGLTVVGMAHDGLEAQEQARLLRPDVILLDVEMPRCDGLTALRALKAELPAIQVVMLTVSEDEETLFTAIQSGASGYLLKNLDAGEFIALLAGLARGEMPLAPGMAARVLAEFNRAAALAESAGLTARQWEILEWAAQGYTYKEIAIKLNLTEPTIKYHMGKILEQLHLNTRAEAVAYARSLRRG